MGTFYSSSIAPDEIYHWMYSRKYRKNGKWVYVYNDGALSDNGQYTKRDQYTTQNGTPLYESTTYKTNKNKWFDSEHKTTSVETDGKNAVVKDHKIIEFGKLHMMKNAFRKSLVSDPKERLETTATGAKYIGKWSAKTIPKIAKTVKKTAPKIAKKVFKETAKYNQRRAFSR